MLLTLEDQVTRQCKTTMVTDAPLLYVFITGQRLGYTQIYYMLGLYHVGLVSCDEVLVCAHLDVLLMLSDYSCDLSQAARLVHTLHSQPVSPALHSKGLWPSCPALIQGLSQAIVKDLHGVQGGSRGGLGSCLGGLHACVIPQELEQLVARAACAC